MIVEAGKFGEVACGWLLIGEVTEKLWAARLGHDGNCGRGSEGFAKVARSGNGLNDSCMYVNFGGVFSSTWRARLQAQARTRLHDMVRMEESVDTSTGWATAQARVVCMRMTWHASRSQWAPLGRQRRSALL